MSQKCIWLTIRFAQARPEKIERSLAINEYRSTHKPALPNNPLDAMKLAGRYPQKASGDDKVYESRVNS